MYELGIDGNILEQAANQWPVRFVRSSPVIPRVAREGWYQGICWKFELFELGSSRVAPWDRAPGGRSSLAVESKLPKP